MAKHYYVTAQDGGRTAWLLGPYSDHAEALDRVRPVREWCLNNIPAAWWWAYGTSSITTDREPPEGKLNGEITE